MRRLRRTVVLGLVLLVAGLAAYAVEAVFYGRVGEDGVLQESVFLPLSLTLSALGAVLVLVGLLRGW